MFSSEDEIDQRLSTDPADIEALVAKADMRRAAGEARAAAAFYRAALQSAGNLARQGPLPMRYKQPIEQAQRFLAEAENSFEQHLMTSLDGAGFAQGSRPVRFQQSLDLLTGRAQTQLELQRPTAYFYPGLPQRRYYEREEFGWAEGLEKHTPNILAELRAWLSGGNDGFSPYMVSDRSRPRTGYHGLVDNPAWSTLYLTEKGQPVPDLAAHFPSTFAALDKVPLARMGVRAPSVLFSRLAPGAHIPPHHGMVNTRLICHLPLVVPPDCGFRVDTEVRQWEEGKLLVFDDTIEHEAWNRSGADRYLLIFDVWRPELSDDERRAVTTLFEILDSRA